MKLIPHRWAMHVIKALSNGEAELLDRIFQELPQAKENINLPIKVFTNGAAFEYYDYGFYDIASATNGRVLGYPERISLGDTLLLLALRLHDPSSVAILIKHGADLNQSNAFDQKPMEILFYIHKLIHGIPPDTSNVTNPTKKHADAFFQEQVLVTKKKQYERLLKEIEPIIQVFHHEIQKNVRSELEALYEAHAPDRLSKIDLQMQEFYLKERELLVAVKRKYT